MKSKPEISYDRQSREFKKDDQPISFDEAKERWYAIDSDWTQGAFRVMNQTLFVKQTPGGIRE
jgi:hypothetical protein